jgi:hypothetical protein
LSSPGTGGSGNGASGSVGRVAVYIA